MISLTGEYAILATVYLTRHSDECPLPARRIAEDLQIPRKYLSSVLHDLVRAGVLVASPGRSGGYQMQREPKNVRLQEVLAPFESMAAKRAIFPFGDIQCSDDNRCAVHKRWNCIDAAYRHFMEETSVYDVSIAKSASAECVEGQQ
ncbi:MAG: Rrf2 family transcriptional regulator [Phycisphaerae bacterium]|nr:MAG: Rrf2 family transcriptional regulator [Phycisphaerae bacterium]